MKAVLSRIRTRGGVVRWRIVIAIVCIAVLFAGALASAMFAGRSEFGWLTTLAGFLVILLVSLLIAQWLYSTDGWLAQRERDIQAADVFAEVSAGGDVQPFILYLRPFASTDAISRTAVRTVKTTTGGLIISTDRLEFEAEIERSLRRFGPVVALGAPLEHRGAGRIQVSDEDWQAAIGQLMWAASLIVLLPSPREGTLWEVDQLIDHGHLGKTLIIDPPNAAENAADYDPAAEWDAIRQAFAARGYTLPEDTKRGQLMRFDGGTTPASRLPIRLDAGRAIRSFVKRAGTEFRPQSVGS